MLQTKYRLFDTNKYEKERFEGGSMRSVGVVGGHLVQMFFLRTNNYTSVG